MLLLRFMFYPLALLVAALAVLVYSPGLPGGFMLDDGVNILRNYILYVNTFDIEQFVLAGLNFHDGNGSRFLPMASFAIDHWRAGGMEPGTFKATNIVIQALTALCMAFFLRRLLILAGWQSMRAAWGALIVALLWAVHPLQVSSVLYVVQRMQTLVTLFIVLALWAYVAMRQVQLAGGRGRVQGVLVVVCWLLALMCKEDAALLPLYTLALELTVLRFAAGQPKAARGLVQSYALIVLLGLALFVFYALPHYWSWGAYGGRDFSSVERLLTQGRVLVMYLGQIVFPWPDNMPFNYDGYVVSRSLWQPWTTLPALLLLAGLLVWAWLWRHKHALFSFGILLFFTGHFLTSNIIGLELVFEHRNHLPLLGVMLALASVLVLLMDKLAISWRWQSAMLTAIILAVGSAGMVRAYTWGEPARLGAKLADVAPQSARSWAEWSNAYFGRYKVTKSNSDLQRAVAISEQGLVRVESTVLAANIVLYKSMLGAVTGDDWGRFVTVLRHSPPGWHRRQVMQMLMMNADNGHITDKASLVQSMEVLLELETPNFNDSMRMGVFAYKADMPDSAMKFFRVAAPQADSDNAVFARLLDELTEQGHLDWADELKAAQQQSID